MASSGNDRGQSRKRLAITFLASALLLALMLAPALRHRSSADDSIDDPGMDDAADQAEDSPSDSNNPLENKAHEDGAAVAVAGHSSDSTHGSITLARLPYTQGSSTLEDASVQEWIALQPFREPSDQQSARDLTARAFDSGANGLAVSQPGLHRSPQPCERSRQPRLRLGRSGEQRARRRQQRRPQWKRRPARRRRQRAGFGEFGQSVGRHGEKRRRIQSVRRRERAFRCPGKRQRQFPRR